jgi:hypothetical protein
MTAQTLTVVVVTAAITLVMSKLGGWILSNLGVLASKIGN